MSFILLPFIAIYGPVHRLVVAVRPPIRRPAHGSSIGALADTFLAERFSHRATSGCSRMAICVSSSSP